MGSDREETGPRQLTIELDSTVLTALSRDERRRLVVLLAQLLLEAATSGLGDDDESP